jgi:uncharacterized protein YecE (DUF72 family)
MGNILVGTSSWADPQLVASGFYPPDIKTAEERLIYYAKQFPVVEIDSSYHFLPTRRNLTAWIEATPPGFAFNVKAFSLLSQHPATINSLPREIRDRAISALNKEGHLYIHNLSEELTKVIWERFVSAIEPLYLAGKLGAITLQFPPWFHPNSQNYEYIVQCKQKLSRYRLAIEFRTVGWLDNEHRETTLQLLRKNGLALVCVDEPQGFKSSLPPLAEATAAFAVISFHGRNRENWEIKDIMVNEKYKYFYREDELQEWIPKIRGLADITEQVMVIFKNKSQDFAVKNALRMIELLHEPAGIKPSQLRVQKVSSS